MKHIARSTWKKGTKKYGAAVGYTLYFKRFDGADRIGQYSTEKAAKAAETRYFNAAAAAYAAAGYPDNIPDLSGSEIVARYEG